jgi:hypothetical protein
MNKLITVTPISSKAKNRFANMMGNDPVCIVEQENDKQLFVASKNRKHFFWMDKQNDLNWKLS